MILRSFAVTIVLVMIVVGLDSTRAFQSILLHTRESSLVPKLLLLLAKSVVHDDDSSLSASAFSLDEDHHKNVKQQEEESKIVIEESDQTSPPADTDTTAVVGLYRRFAEHAWERLEALTYMKDANIDPELQSNHSPATVKSNKQDGSSPATSSTTSVHMTVKALVGAVDNVTTGIVSPIRYARYALLETLPSSSSSSSSWTTTNVVSSTGIQVLNFVIFPNGNLPVWGADFVTLPGNKHLLLLDAQPMMMMMMIPSLSNPTGEDDCYSQHWKEWYKSHQIDEIFPWGGDLPERVQPFVSKYALWSRLSGRTNTEGELEPSAETIRTIVDGPLFQAYCDHLDCYLQLVEKQCCGIDQPSSTINHQHRQREYIAYRLENDPARPMLKRLFGEEWTEKVLEKVLFPNM